MGREKRGSAIQSSANWFIILFLSWFCPHGPHCPPPLTTDLPPAPLKLRPYGAIQTVRLSVCLMSRTSALTRKPKGLGRRNFAQGYPRSHATPTPFKFGTHIGRGQFLPMDHKLAPSIQVKLKIASKEDHDSGVDP